MTTQPLIDINSIREWLTEAGRIALTQFNVRVVDIKSDSIPVTQIDKQIEATNYKTLPKSRSVLAEEGSSRPGNDFTWIIDPIDGTRAFASGLPGWGISVRVFHAGVFYIPATKEMY